MPRFSVIVPAFRVQAYLGECLASVLGQSFEDFELIVVDDCSPDGTGEVLDDFARLDPRVTALHLDRSVGPGHARNAALDAATGDYLLFVDSDDTMTPGSLQAIADRLDEVGDPDLLVYDYARTFWDGRTVRSADAGLLAPDPDRPQVFELARHEGLLSMLTVVWNKAYRRGFVEANGFRFPTGYYEDVPWMYSTLIAAETVATLDRVVVHYRQRREGGNILTAIGRRHLDAVTAYDRVFAFLDEHPDLREQWAPALHRRMVHHLVSIGNHPARVPASAHDEFFDLVVRAEQRHRPAGAPALPVNDRGGWRVGALGRAARSAKRTAMRAKPGLRAAVAQPVLGGYQRLQRALPIDENLAVFSSYWSRTPACNPAAIHAELRRLVPDMRTVWVVHPGRRAGAPEGLTFVAPGSRGYWEAISRAKYFVNNVNFPDNVPKRPGTVHLQTHHGTPVKKMGLDLREYPAAGMDFEKLLQRVDRWDYSLTSNRFSTLIWERVYPSAFTSLEYGYPRNDVYYRATAEDVRAARAELGVADDATVLLYAPTVRDYRTSYRPQVDLERLAARLGPGFVLLNRAHYFYEPAERSQQARPGARIIHVSDHPSVERLALASDALVTDYSSVMFDYANLDRPIIVLADDWEVYRESRGVYLDLVSGRPGETPGAVARSQAELEALLLDGSWRSAEAAGLRAAFRARFCQFDDGHAAERVVRTVFLGETEPLPVTPLAARTPAPSPEETRSTPPVKVGG